MTGVVLWSCAINLLLTSSSSVSGLARYGNSITLPLPNLVAKLAILLRSVLCGHYSDFIFLFFCSSCLFLSFISVCLLKFIVQTQIIYSCVWWLPMQSEHLPFIARCSLCVHRLSSIGFILFLCVCIIVHVDFSLMSHDREETVLVSRFSSVDKVVILLKWMWLVSWQVSLLQLYCRASECRAG